MSFTRIHLTENRSQKAEDGCQKTKSRKQKAENRGQKTEDGRQRAEDGGQRKIKKEIIIFKKAYDLALEIFKATKSFPKSQRFLMAGRLEETVIKILEEIIQANESQDKTPQLKELSAYLERLRILTRLSEKVRGWISYAKYADSYNLRKRLLTDIAFNRDT